VNTHIDTAIVTSNVEPPATRNIPMGGILVLGQPGMLLRHCQILTSLELLTELDEVLSQPKFNRYLRREESTRFLQAFIQQAVLIEVTEHIEVCRDPKDNMVLELAVSGGARHIVTGDADLRGLTLVRGITIASPDAFVARIRPVW
jgi:putative PIN family toxin of toxin-antitoxin system